MIITYQYRIKNLEGLLNKQAKAVNYVFNFCNDRQKDALRFGRKWLTGFDLDKLTAGSSKELGLHSSTINAVTAQYASSRAQKKKPYLRYRGKKSLGWVPLKGRELKRSGEDFVFAGNTFKVFYSRPLPEGKIKDGTNFSRDTKGNWYLNIVIEVAEAQQKPIVNGVGIDLGLKDFATLSTGESIPAQKVYRELEPGLAVAQRAHKKKRVKAIHQKISNRRKDFHHKLSSALVEDFEYIAVGNVNAAGLAKTTMAKSVLDAGWSSFRKQLIYKAIKHGVWYEEVNESYSTQTCSQCGSIEGPRGVAGLAIRTWECSCGAEHNRDVNSARNILHKSKFRIGQDTPVEGIPAL